MWTVKQNVYARSVLKMLPIMYWAYNDPSIFNVSAMIGDLALLSSSGFDIGVLSFMIGHASLINYNYDISLLWILSFGLGYLQVSSKQIMLIIYALILRIRMYQNMSWSLFWLIFSDALIGIDMLTIPGSIKYIDTLTIGTYWLGMYLCN